MTDYAARAKQILDEINYATVATVSKDGLPWNTPVRHVYDHDLNIYWFSDKESIHSVNVRSCEDVFIVIYDSTVPEGDGEGVYFQAKAHELSDPDEIIYAQRLEKGQYCDRPLTNFLGDAVRRAYKAVPQRAWINDAEIKDDVFIRDYRIEIPIQSIANLYRSSPMSLPSPSV